MLRYPVEIGQAAEIDDEMTRAVMRVIASNPQLKSALSGDTQAAGGDQSIGRAYWIA